MTRLLFTALLILSDVSCYKTFTLLNTLLCNYTLHFNRIHLYRDTNNPPNSLY